MRGPTRPVGEEQKVTSIKVKQVQVRAIDRNVAGLRASKELGAKDVGPAGSMGSLKAGASDAGTGVVGEGSTRITEGTLEQNTGPTVEDLFGRSLPCWGPGLAGYGEFRCRKCI